MTWFDDFQRHQQAMRQSVPKDANATQRRLAINDALVGLTDEVSITQYQQAVSLLMGERVTL